MNPDNVYEYNWSTIERSIARIMVAKNWTREEAYRQCFSRVGTGVGTGARTNTRKSAANANFFVKHSYRPLEAPRSALNGSDDNHTPQARNRF